MKNIPSHLSNLKIKTDVLDVDKLVPVPVDLIKLSYLVKNDIVKKDVYNANINNIEDKIPDITNLATNATPNAKINEIKNKILNITNFATTTALNAKLNEVKNKIPNITNLATTATTTALTAVENKILGHSNYITNPEFNKLLVERFAARIKTVKKTNFDGKLKTLNKKLLQIKQKMFLLKKNQMNYRKKVEAK